MRLFDDRYKRTTWPYGSAVRAKKNGSVRACATIRWSRWTKAGPIYFWADRFGRGWSRGLVVKQCGNSRYWLVQRSGGYRFGFRPAPNVGGDAGPRGGLCFHGDTSASLAAYAAAAGISAIVLLPRGKVETAQLVQPPPTRLVFALDTDLMAPCYRAAPLRRGRRVPG